MKKILAVLALVFICLVSAFASAASADFDFVKINGDEFNGETQNFDREEIVDIRVSVKANQDLFDTRVEARIDSFEYGIISDASDIEDMESGEVKRYNLKLNLPNEMDLGQYTLTILLLDREGIIQQLRIPIVVDAERHLLQVKHISFSPGDRVRAGNALLATVNMENDGEDDEEVVVTVSIPDLGVSAQDFIDEIEADETTTSEELYLRIPRCAEPGQYEVVVSVEYNEGFDVITQKRTVTVEDSGLCEEANADDENSMTDIMLGTLTGTETVEEDQTANFPVTITNGGNKAVTYTLNVAGTDSWANVEVVESNVMTIQPKASKTAVIKVTPKEDVEGNNVFTLTVKAGDETIEQIPLSVTVQKDNDWDVKGFVKGLTIALIVIIVLLILVGLIAAFRRSSAKNDEDMDELDDEKEGQTYY